ncbi:MAG: divalent-cation tolerance protein CutA [Caldisericia bacterium]|nr:divalent-cation tolerance protein CutA [Caldisericia bacterium]
MEDKLIMVLTTIDDIEKARKLARFIVDQRLGACIQIIGPIQSIYFWREKVEDAKEWILFIKTRKDLYEKLEELIIKLHPYTVPEIVSFDIEKSFNKYFNWVFEVTTQREKDDH